MVVFNFKNFKFIRCSVVELIFMPKKMSALSDAQQRTEDASALKFPKDAYVNLLKI